MPQAIKYDISGKELGNVDLPESVFSEKVNEHAVHQVVVAQLPIYVEVLLLQKQGEK